MGGLCKKVWFLGTWGSFENTLLFPKRRARSTGEQREVSKVILVTLKKKNILLKDCWAHQKAKGTSNRLAWPLWPGDILALYSPRPAVCISQRKQINSVTNQGP